MLRCGGLVCNRSVLRRASCCVLRTPPACRTHTEATGTTTGVDHDRPQFPGAGSCSWTQRLQFATSEQQEPLPVYRVLDDSGQVLDPGQDEDPSLSPQMLVDMYEKMVLLRAMDTILYESQRQGRISFYMTNSGEEATQLGSAAALFPEDFIYGQYREAGVLMHRGFSLTQFVDQCYGNIQDMGKGRQMPVHYGSRELNFCTISSPLATQMPQAVGTAYAFKLRHRPLDRCVVCYFGEGGSSEGDAHAAFNFGAVLRAPVIFLCRNNGYAISTPTSEQYCGDAVAARGPAYGMPAVRVDGNDALAVYKATAAARQMAVRQSCAVLLEAMTYRVGHHSTSDDSSAYRPASEPRLWQDRPLSRLRAYLQRRDLWNDEREALFQTQCRRQVLDAMNEAERRPRASWRQMFGDVYDQPPPHLERQLHEMTEHMKIYGQHYPVTSDHDGTP